MSQFSVFFTGSIHVVICAIYPAGWQLIVAIIHFVFSLGIFEEPNRCALKKYLLHIFFFLVFPLSALSQQERRFAFIHYGMTQGLTSNEVMCSVQDDDGYLWIGTNNGLQRYDGVRFLTFRHQKDNPVSVPGNFIQQLMIDSKGNMWLQAAGKKAGIFDTKKFVFREVEVSPANETYMHGFKKIVEDEAGNIMMVIANLQLLTYNKEKNEFSEQNNFIKFPREWGIVDVINIPGTLKYILGTQHGLAIYNNKTGQLSYTGHNAEKELLIEKAGELKATTHFMFDKGGRLWFDTWDEFPRLYCYDYNRGQFILDRYDILLLTGAYHEIHGFLQQRDGSVWVYGLGVFAQYIEKTRQFQKVYNGYENEQSIAYSKVGHILEDKEKNMWVSTNNNGIYLFNPAEQFFTNIHHTNRMNGKPGDGSAMSFVRTNNGTLLAGTWGDGLYRYDSNFNMLPLNIKGFDNSGTKSIWAMFPSRDKNIIWMASQPGVHKYDQAKNQVTFYDPAAIKGRTVRQIAEDRFGNLWLGTQSLGLFKWPAKNGIIRPEDSLIHFKAIPENQISKILVDKQGNIWVATAGFGLYVIDPATSKVIMHFGTAEVPERKLPSNSIPVMLEYNDTTMLIAAEGIHLFNSKSRKMLRTIGTSETITGGIAALERDRFGYVWASTTTGIYRINIFNNIFIRFDRVDGIANDYFIVAASLTLPDGRILFGADNQFVFFNPASVQINDVAPPVRITGFSLMNKPLLVDSLLNLDRVDLAPEENSIKIDFSGLSYNNAYIIKYKLEGIDKNWRIADRNYQAIYSYLPPGNYTFLVRSEDAEGRPGKTVTKLVIKIRPPFWRTWWFLGLVIFAITAILFWLDKLRLQKLRATEAVRTRIATSLTEDMSNSLSSINISSELAKTKVDTDTQRTKEYINQISDTSNRMVQSMYDMVWSIDPKNDTMEDTMQRMKSFAAEIENIHHVSIDFDTDRQVEQLGLDMELRYELLCIYKEAVTNAARHADGRFIKISLRYSRPKLVMMILDDGKGFAMDSAAMLGRGISEMRRRAAAINAILYIESEINTGTVVKLEMPV
ncbi:MAG: hypothetical protein J0L56_00440 [Chitinophagales bacterium]|nr:hypothetical protein [Chitinophagales bacterium]